MNRRNLYENEMDYSKGELELALRWREEYLMNSYSSKVTREDYNKSTKANFRNVTDKIRDWRSFAARNYSTYKQSKTTGSSYVVIGDTLYRRSDHWGKVGTNIWKINDKKPGFNIGAVELSRMIRLNAKDPSLGYSLGAETILETAIKILESELKNPKYLDFWGRIYDEDYFKKKIKEYEGLLKKIKNSRAFQDILSEDDDSQGLYDNQGLFEGENEPTNPALWKNALAWARSRYKVCPSAYCNGAAAKRYKQQGGGWRKKSKKK